MSARGPVYTWEGAKLTVSWDQRLCIHVGECTRAGSVFESGRDPWCSPDLAEVGDVADIVQRCPTGALTFERSDGGPLEDPATDNTVVVANAGPLYLCGDLRIEGTAADMPGVRLRAALCRCGQSKRKPFCDGSHEEAGFHDQGAVGQRGDGFESAGGELTVQPLPNGPLLVNGNLTIVSGSGRVAWQGTKAALCRCGSSKNKPFCDGTHKEIGFQAD